MIYEQDKLHKYSVSMRVLHWSMATLMIGLLIYGVYIHQIPWEDPGKAMLANWHRAFGVLAFGLIIIRLICKLASVIPELPASMPWYERKGAKSAQIFLYQAMFVVPAVGYIASSAVPDFPGAPPVLSIWFFGLDLPLFPIEKNYETVGFFGAIHEYVGYAMIAVIAAHIIGAFKHRFFDKPENDVLSKMI